MCGIFESSNSSFKWVICLVIVTGIYTFLHFFVAVPLLYFHFYECCNEKWTSTWVVWFLVSAIGCWIGFLVPMLLIWCCLRLFFVRHLNESSVYLTDKKHAIHPDVMINEKTMAAIEDKNSTKGGGEPEEIVVLPEFDPKESFAILQMNDVQPENPAPETDLEIPLDETRVHVQSENVTTPEKPVKSPREIFFQDLIEGASDSYFGFDPDKISEFVKSKYEKSSFDEKTFFLGSNEKNDNMTSEVMVTLNENGVVVDEPVAVGQFEILKG